MQVIYLLRVVLAYVICKQSYAEVISWELVDSEWDFELSRDDDFDNVPGWSVSVGWDHEVTFRVIGTGFYAHFINVTFRAMRTSGWAAQKSCKIEGLKDISAIKAVQQPSSQFEMVFQHTFTHKDRFLCEPSLNVQYELLIDGIRPQIYRKLYVTASIPYAAKWVVIMTCLILSFVISALLGYSEKPKKYSEFMSQEFVAKSAVLAIDCAMNAGVAILFESILANSSTFSGYHPLMRLFLAVLFTELLIFLCGDLFGEIGGQWLFVFRNGEREQVCLSADDMKPTANTLEDTAV